MQSEETLEAKLRNLLTPLYSLADIVVLSENNKELHKISIDVAKQAIINKEKINELLILIEKQHETK